MSSSVQADDSGIIHRGGTYVLERGGLLAGVSSTSALGTKIWFVVLAISQPSRIRVTAQLSCRCTAVSRPFFFLTIGGAAFGINGGSPDGTWSATIPAEATSIPVGPASVEIAAWMGRDGSGTVTCNPFTNPASDNFTITYELIRA